MRVKKEINIQIGERIKAAREFSGRTQEQLAEAIDVSPSTFPIWSGVSWEYPFQH